MSLSIDFAVWGSKSHKNTPETMYGEMAEILYLFPAENQFFCSRAQRRKVSWAM